MKLEIENDPFDVPRTGPPTVTVTLSRRNLKVLLAKLDGHPWRSACTITNYDGHLIVKAEEDDAHYGQRQAEGGPGPGPMHPDTEAEL